MSSVKFSIVTHQVLGFSSTDSSSVHCFSPLATPFRCVLRNVASSFNVHCSQKSVVKWVNKQQLKQPDFSQVWHWFTSCNSSSSSLYNLLILLLVSVASQFLQCFLSSCWIVHSADCELYSDIDGKVLMESCYMFCVFCFFFTFSWDFFFDRYVTESSVAMTTDVSQAMPSLLPGSSHLFCLPWTRLLTLTAERSVWSKSKG